MSSMFKPIKFEQPKKFEFTKENLEKAKQLIAKYPKGKQQSAVMPLLDLAQRQHKNWLPIAAMDYIANLLDMPTLRVYEVASFYTMFNKQPVGEHLIQICRTSPCWLKGSDDITKACKDKLAIDIGETTADDKFTLVEVECLGACVNAPVIQINDDYYEDIAPNDVVKIIDKLSKGEKPKPGSQINRQCSAPITFSLTPEVIAKPKRKTRTKAKK